MKQRLGARRPKASSPPRAAQSKASSRPATGGAAPRQPAAPVLQPAAPVLQPAAPVLQPAGAPPGAAGVTPSMIPLLAPSPPGAARQPADAGPAAYRIRGTSLFQREDGSQLYQLAFKGWNAPAKPGASSSSASAASAPAPQAAPPVSLFDAPGQPTPVLPTHAVQPTGHTSTAYFPGEGDFSYAAAFAKKHPHVHVKASSYDPEPRVAEYPQGRQSLASLAGTGGVAEHGINVLRPPGTGDGSMSPRKVDLFQFNFPHTGTGSGAAEEESEERRKFVEDNRTLVRGFFQTARDKVHPQGRAKLSYKAAGPYKDWRVEDLADEEGWVKEADEEFEELPGYSHVETRDTEGTVSNRAGRTLTFRRKPEPQRTGVDPAALAQALAALPAAEPPMPAAQAPPAPSQPSVPRASAPSAPSRAEPRAVAPPPRASAASAPSSASAAGKPAYYTKSKPPPASPGTVARVHPDGYAFVKVKGVGDVFVPARLAGSLSRDMKVLLTYKQGDKGPVATSIRERK
jgi:hypothetical protein